MKLIDTNDGSPTLYHETLNESYHSINGALSESKWVFINNGLDRISKNKAFINLLEVGFGTGLNALLTLDYALEHHLNIHYIAVEPHPLSLGTISKLDYTSCAHLQHLKSHFHKMHEVDYYHDVLISDHFMFNKVHDIFKIAKMDNKIDLVYQDAFSPNKAPELWSMPFMSDIYLLMQKQGALTTYCANGQFKRLLKTLGFKVIALPGASGKREMTLAIKL